MAILLSWTQMVFLWCSDQRIRPRRKPRTAKGPETNAKNRGSTTRFQNNMVVLLSLLSILI